MWREECGGRSEDFVIGHGGLAAFVVYHLARTVNGVAEQGQRDGAFLGEGAFFASEASPCVAER